MEYKLTIDDLNETMKNEIDPELAAHFGSAFVTGYEDGIVSVKMDGACASCPSAQDTMNSVVKEKVMAIHSEVKDVVLDTSISEDLLDFARKILNKDKNIK